MGSKKAGGDLGLHLLPSSSPGNSWKLLPTQSQTGFPGVQNNDGDYTGKGSPARSRRQWDPPAAVPAPAALTSHRSPALWHARSGPLAASASFLRASPNASLPLTPPRPVASHVYPAGGPSPHPVRSPTSSLQVWRTERHCGLAGVNSASPATHRPRARAHPAAAFSNLSASVSSMMRLFTSSRIMAAAAPGRGRRNKGG